MKYLLASACVVLFVPTAQPQSQPNAASPSTIAQTQPSKPTSAFAQYRKFTPGEKRSNWRADNDRVEALDGHMGHVRGAPKPRPSMESKK